MLLYGTFVHTPEKGVVEVLRDTLVVVDITTGIIAEIKSVSPAELGTVAAGYPTHTLTTLSSTQFILPGFIDTHIHAPQITYTGTGTDVPLMEWLSQYAFPAEKRFKDASWAQHVYPKLVDRLLRNGTTTALYFGSLHLEANQILADITLSAGQRAYIGKVCIDQYGPDDYIESTDQAIQNTEAFIQYCQDKDTDLLVPVVTPRFIPTCSSVLLEKLGRLARQYDVPIQSHISESLDEVAFVKQLYPDENDTQIFDRTGLLTSRTVMAHGVHLSQKDVDVLQERGTAVAVCPLSNAYFANGVFPCTRFSQLSQGLGTDVAGGYAPSMLASIRHLCVASRYLELHSPGSRVDWKMGLYLATMGGAHCLSIQDKVGTFHVGKQFDGVLVDVAASGTPIDVYEGEDYVEKFIHLGDDRNIAHVWVQGRRVI
ncbi:hypothetical protein BJV82DRAFT_674905 [Fennellomyces sp. T-0311]|nr:hypothetical protein BJV82DRAFT_674905 [Fennellomyces sp. T-0311]